jgi:hypothetical protein
MIRQTVIWCEAQLATKQQVDTKMLLSHFCGLLRAEAARLLTMYDGKPDETKRGNAELEMAAGKLIDTATKHAAFSTSSLRWARSNLAAVNFRQHRPMPGLDCLLACVDFKFSWWPAFLLSDVASIAHGW